MNQANLASASLNNAPLEGKRVLIRLDLDLPMDEAGQINDIFRLKQALPTLKKCLNSARQMTLIGHLGRPEGRDRQYSLIQLADTLGGLLNKPITFVENPMKLPRVKNGQSGENVPNIQLLENLRFWPGETSSDAQFASFLAEFGDLYVNEAFASSHRSSASITSLPHLLPTYLGFQFLQELGVLNQVLQQGKKPIVVVLGGAKPDKLELLPELLKMADKVLLGGKLPLYVKKADPKLILGELNSEQLDLTPRSQQEFIEIISRAGTIVWNGPVGKFEDPSHQTGTKMVAEAIASSPAYSLVGGGDTQAALKQFGGGDKVDHVSVGGGAMLTYLATGTLPALEVLG